jgi:O-antigen/teichoic acid export membrane protein
MLTFSINTFLYTTGTVILYQSMKMIAAANAGGMVAAGHMGLAVSIAQILSVVFVPLVSVMHPRTRSLASRGLHEQIPGLLRKSLVVIGAIATPTILFIWGATPLILEAWVGDSLSAESIERLVRTVRFMMPGQWIFIVFLPCYFALVGLGQHRVFGIGLVAAGIANAILGWIATDWMPTTEPLGIVFSIVMVILVFSTTLPATLKHFHLSAGTALYEAIVLPCVLTLPGLVMLGLAPAVGDRFVDLAIAGVFFAVGAGPGMLMARRKVNQLG